MCSVALITLLAFVAQSHGEEAAASQMSDSQMDELSDQFMAKFANKLVDRVLKETSFVDDAGLDTTTFGKPSNLGALQDSPHLIASYLAPSADQQPFSEEELEREEEERQVTQPGHGYFGLTSVPTKAQLRLDNVLGLRGGAKKAPAMKAAAMKSAPMKAMKAMKAAMSKAAVKAAPVAMKAAPMKAAPMKAAPMKR